MVVFRGNFLFHSNNIMNRIVLSIIVIVMGNQTPLIAAEQPIKSISGKIVVLHHLCEITPGKSRGKILIAWEITNNSKSHIRFRIRDLGRITIADSNSKEIQAKGLGVDHTKRIEGRDYPIIAPGQTMYFPFSALFYQDPKSGLTLELKSDPNGQDGWKYTNLKLGEYKIKGTYKVHKKIDKDGSLSVELETLMAQGLGYEGFWEGDINSDEIDITIR